jgi:2-C-methyl-D-erythritol 4-phosphate cytidylyltransferase
MKASAIIVAAGSGKRLGIETPKAFVNVGRVSLVRRVLQTIGQVSAVREIVVAVPAGMEKAARAEAQGVNIPVKITEGGAERQDSVRRALVLTSSESDLIVVHDAARPFATLAMFEACIAAAADNGGAVAAIALADTLKRVEDGTIRATVHRAGLWQAQTPQVFRREWLVGGHEFAVRERLTVTDDAELVERLGHRMAVVEGSPINLKITTPDDLRLAEALARCVFPR